MISFKPLSEESSREIVALLMKEGGADAADARELVDAFLCDGSDIEYAVSACHGCALVRVFDMGRYLFLYPIDMEDGADPLSAVEEIRAYAVKEEIPLVISDVPASALGETAAHFRHTNVDAEGAGESFRISVKSECSLLDTEPELQSERITVGALCEGDTERLARLNRDPEVNKYWGYDYREDFGEVEDGYFLQSSREELVRGNALTLAVRLCDEYIGEIIFYAFDLRGSAEIGIRLLPKYMGRGYGGEALDAALEIGEGLGLLSLTATVDSRNGKSRRLMSRRFNEICEKDGRVYYRYEYNVSE